VRVVRAPALPGFCTVQISGTAWRTWPRLLFVPQPGAGSGVPWHHRRCWPESMAASIAVVGRMRESTVDRFCLRQVSSPIFFSRLANTAVEKGLRQGTVWPRQCCLNHGGGHRDRPRATFARSRPAAAGRGRVGGWPEKFRPHVSWLRAPLAGSAWRAPKRLPSCLTPSNCEE